MGRKLDMQDIVGQEHAKRGMEVAASGKHNVILMGSSKKDMVALARRFDTIYEGEYQIFDLDGKDIKGRPDVMTIGMMHLCPCGKFTHPKYVCKCTPDEVKKYLTDKFNIFPEIFQMHLEVVPVRMGNIARRRGEASEEIKARIDHIREMKRRADINTTGMATDATELFKLAIVELGLSDRACKNITSMAETIARMDGKGTIESHHLSEAISYRSLDTTIWG